MSTEEDRLKAEAKERAATGHVDDPFVPPRNYVFSVGNTIRKTVIRFVTRKESDASAADAHDKDADDDVEDKAARSGDDDDDDAEQTTEEREVQERGIPFSHVDIDPTAVKQDQWQPVKIDSLSGSIKWVLLYGETARLLDGYSIVMHSRTSVEQPDVAQVLEIYAMPRYASEIEYARNFSCLYCTQPGALFKCACVHHFCDSVCLADARRNGAHTEAACRLAVAQSLAETVAHNREDLNEINRRTNKERARIERLARRKQRRAKTDQTAPIEK